MTKFRKAFDHDSIKCHVIGSDIKEEIRMTRDTNGNCIYKKVGESKISENVNSYKNSAALTSILQRIQLMPVRDKISYLNQTENGISADVSRLPKDGTEAFIILSKYQHILPSIAKRMYAGESLNDILKSIYANNDNKEVNNNGEAESSDAGSDAV